MSTAMRLAASTAVSMLACCLLLAQLPWGLLCLHELSRVARACRRPRPLPCLPALSLQEGCSTACSLAIDLLHSSRRALPQLPGTAACWAFRKPLPPQRPLVLQASQLPSAPAATLLPLLAAAAFLLPCQLPLAQAAAFRLLLRSCKPPGSAPDLAAGAPSHCCSTAACCCCPDAAPLPAASALHRSHAAHLAPDDAVQAALLLGLGLEDEGQLLAEVEVNLALGVHTVDLDQGGVVVLVGLRPASGQVGGAERGGSWAPASALSCTAAARLPTGCHPLIAAPAGAAA